MEGMVGVYPADQYPNQPSAGQLRRTRPHRLTETTRLLSLVDIDGILFWQEGSGHSLTGDGLRRSFRGPARRGEIIDRVRVDQLEPNMVTSYLEHLDSKLTPNQGLRVLEENSFRLLTEPPVSKGRILLLLHGTFSKSEMYVDEFRATKEGTEFLDGARHTYDQILGFDHPTLAISPVLNALDLSRRLASSEADVDVISHSRGGLVCRWWLEALDRGQQCKRRAILVGSPLEGTSLASPPRIRSLLSWFTNLSQVLGHGASLAAPVLPFMTVVSGLLRIAAAVTSIGARTPLADAGVAMIPGLSGQSRVRNNLELQRLNEDPHKKKLEYYAVRSRFTTTDPAWRFWKYFADPGVRALNAAADLLFQEANDLVVDSASMTRCVPDDEDHICDFGESSDVHHINYFRQPETIRFISEKLRDPP